MRILVVGGTVFVGRAIVDAARASGHEVTVVHRGSSPLHRDDVAEVLGDREESAVLSRLAAMGPWDVVVDTCGYVPRVVDLSARALSGVCDRYVFISTVSVYAHLERPGVEESSALHEPPPPDVEQVEPATYGPLKVACERAVEARLPGRVLQVRPGLLVGPHDPTGRFPYWVRRIDEGGRVLVPATDQALQLLDARDLGSWVAAAAGSGHVGAVNLVGPPGGLAWDEALGTVAEIAGGDAELVPVDPAWLGEHGVEPGKDLPLWPGPERGDGMMHVDDALARSLGLTRRRFAATASDTLAWVRRSPAAAGGAEPGLARAREAELLAALAS